MAKSLLFSGTLPFSELAACAPCRQTQSTTFQKNGVVYTLTVNDKISVEDPYLLLVQAGAFAIANQQPYSGTRVPRDVRDYLIKNNLSS